MYNSYMDKEYIDRKIQLIEKEYFDEIEGVEQHDTKLQSYWELKRLYKADMLNDKGITELLRVLYNIEHW